MSNRSFNDLVSISENACWQAIQSLSGSLDIESAQFFKNKIITNLMKFERIRRNVTIKTLEIVRINIKKHNSVQAACQQASHQQSL